MEIKVDKEIKKIKNPQTGEKEEILLNYNILTKNHKGKTIYWTEGEMRERVKNHNEILEEFDKWLIQEQSSQNPK